MRIARFAVTVSFVALVMSAAQAFATPPSDVEPQPDGMNCDQVAWVKPPSCASWKAFNASSGSKWWVAFSKDDGYVHTLFANRGGKVPGVDLSRILRSTARSDRATQVLLRDYADRRLRAFVDELGLDRSLSDLAFSDFRSEPGTTVPSAQAGAASVVVKSENLPAVFHIDLAEVIDKVPVEDAGITVTVDASNALLSIDSTYQTARPLGAGSPRLGTTQAAAIALAATGVDPAQLVVDPPVATNVWVLAGTHLDLAWQVDVATSVSSQLVTIFDRSGAVRDVASIAASACPVPNYARGAKVSLQGFVDGVGQSYVNNHPRLEYPSPTFFGFTLDSLTTDIQPIALPDLCSFSGPDAPRVNGFPIGRYVDVYDAEATPHQGNASFDLQVADPVEAVLRIDDNSLGNASPGGQVKPMATSTPDPEISFAVDPVLNTPDGRALEESMTYATIDASARFFKEHFGWELSQADNTNPDIPVTINVNVGDGGNANAMWVPTTVTGFFCDGQFECTEVGSQIVAFPGDRLLPVGDNIKVFNQPPLPPGPPRFVDEYAAANIALDRTLLAHEFGHAMNWDVSGIYETTAARARYHEALADYWSATVRDESRVGSWVFADDDYFVDDLTEHACRPDTSAGTLEQGGRQLDQPSPLVWPFDSRDTGVQTPDCPKDGAGHHDGRMISGPLWDLRKRMILLGQEIPLTGAGASIGDRFAWGSLHRVKSGGADFVDVLHEALDVSNASFGRRLDHEVLAAFARHGIQTGPRIAVIRPDHFVLDGRTGDAPELDATAYLGTRQNYRIEFTTDPAAFCPIGAVLCLPDSNRHSNPSDAAFNYVSFVGLGNASDPFPIHPIPDRPTTLPAIPIPFNQADAVVPNDLLEKMAAAEGATLVAISMRVTTFGSEGAVTSHLDNTPVPDPQTFYIVASAPPGCSCRIAGGHERTAAAVPLALVLATAIIFFRVRRSRTA